MRVGFHPTFLLTPGRDSGNKVYVGNLPTRRDQMRKLAFAAAILTAAAAFTPASALDGTVGGGVRIDARGLQPFAGGNFGASGNVGSGASGYAGGGAGGSGYPGAGAGYGATLGGGARAGFGASAGAGAGLSAGSLGAGAAGTLGGGLRLR
jgi:hypothetical protein